jgi:hypothetical protein
MRIAKILIELYNEKNDLSKRVKYSNDLSSFIEHECYFLFFKKTPSPHSKKPQCPKIVQIKSIEEVLTMHLY